MSKTPKILLVEDDPVQAEWIVDQVVKYFPNEPLAGYLKYLNSEKKFTDAIPQLHNWGPQFALLDRTINYYSKDDVKNIDPEVVFKNPLDPHRAWMRCRDSLLQACPGIKVAVLTVHETVPDMNPNDVIIQKGDDAMTVKLGQFLRQIA